MSWREVDPITLPRYQTGVDYGRPRHVLARKGDRQIVVTPGHTAWVSVGQSGYYPVTVDMSTVTTPVGGFPDSTEAFEGRITKAKIAAATEKMAEWLGVDELPPIHRRKTFIWEGNTS